MKPNFVFYICLNIKQSNIDFCVTKSWTMYYCITKFIKKCTELHSTPKDCVSNLLRHIETSEILII